MTQLNIMPLKMPGQGRITLAMAVKAWPVFLGVGEGRDEWGFSPPSVDLQSNRLERPAGFVRARLCEFVRPDNDGGITADDGARWSISKKPTPFLYMLFVLGMRDLPDKIVRELGIFLDTKPHDNVPLGREVIDMAYIADHGHLLAIKRTPPIVRMGSRHTFGEIMSF
ncbi:MAG: hypothetical protein L3J67_07990 [Hyphomicrobiaceae bacterium]|nr:hypothetical protein [Hyphomicrobiaceae bacterium]